MHALEAIVWGRRYDSDWVGRGFLSPHNMKVAVLGPAGTYSHEAAKKRFTDVDAIFCSTLPEVIEAVDSSRADAGMLPFENSTNGPVQPALGALAEAKLANVRAKGVIRVPIQHQLYTKAKDLKQIKTVYSHPQVWGQVKNWLAQNLPYARLVDANSTGQAVAHALGARDGSIAAIGGPNAAPVTALVSNCSDDRDNSTSFLVLRHTKSEAKPQPSTKGPCRVWALVRNTRIADALTHFSHVNFTAAVPSSDSWKSDVFIEFTLSKNEELVLRPEWEVLGVVKLHPGWRRSRL